MMSQMNIIEETKRPSKGRNNMMESARLRADIVSGLGAEDESPPDQKVLEAEPARKYATMKTKQDDDANKNKGEADGIGLFDRSVITINSNNDNKRAKDEPIRAFKSENLEDISRIQGGDATVAFMDGKEGMELFDAIGGEKQEARTRSLKMQQ